MPHRTRIAALLATVALLAMPALAVAQSGGAGDQQYQDPFSGQSNGSKGSSGSSGSSSGSGLSQSAPSSSGTTTAAPTASAAPATSTRSGQLASTGIDLRLVAGLGLLLLVAGIALRRSGHARR